jgi:hypothetical protein
MPGRRDPVSELFDPAARRLLAKAYASPGQWVSVWLPDPSVRQRTAMAAAGVTSDLTGPDPVPAGGGLNARTRWARGFVRAAYYQHKWYSPARSEQGFRGVKRTAPRNTGGLRVEVGRHVAASPQWDPANPAAGGFPPRRRIRMQLARGGRAKDAAVARLADRDRSFTGPKGSRVPGPRWANPAVNQDW